MIIKRLQIENLRNLSLVDIEPHPRLNYIYGANGAGKTSILEALVVLSRGRSFRTTQAGELIGPVKNTFRVYSSALDRNKQEQRLGLERSGKRWRGRKNGTDLSQLSQLTRVLPLVLMEPDSHLLISGPPEIRRKYLDWGLFHVEHSFLESWRRFSKALKQRNAALRRGQIEILDSLDSVLAEYGDALGVMRRAHCESISVNIEKILMELNAGLSDMSVGYSDGWPPGSYHNALVSGRDRDLERQMTIYGPHRADLVLKCKSSPAKAILSRGEQKTLAAALLLTQAEILVRQGELPIILLDDLASEFDKKHFNDVLSRSLKIGGQIWLTGTDSQEIPSPHKVFHVEQGKVQEVL